MDIYKNTTVYIICPSATATGGPLLLHQLGHLLLQRGIRTFMVYVPYGDNPVAVPYRKYHIPYTDQVADCAENIVILPETGIGFSYRSARIIFWWMSVDNWAGSIADAMKACQQSSFHSPLPYFFYFQRDIQITHWTQSEYAYRFLRRNGVSSDRISRVEDYLDPIFLQNRQQVDAQDKHNWVVFNPKKGAAFTLKLVKAAPDIQWMVIKDMSAIEVEALLAASKLYIDFGHHPGKDRIPREAVVSGCCLITSRRGSAENEVDIPIDDSYKFADEDQAIPQILEKIRAILSGYAQHVENFAAYRNSILQERQKFIQAVDAALPQKAETAPARRIALLYQNASTVQLLQMVMGLDGVKIVFIVDNGSAGDTLQDEAGVEVPVISIEDARFLYTENRIDCFVGRIGQVPMMLQQQLLCRNQDWWLV